MAIPGYPELVRLPEDTAFDWLVNARNLQKLNWLLGVLSVLSFALLIFRLFEARWLAIVAPITLLAVARAASILGEERVAKPSFRWFMLVTLGAVFTLSALLYPEFPHSSTMVGILGSLSLILFRLRPLDTALLLLLLLAVAAVPFAEISENPEPLMVQAALAATVLFLCVPAGRSLRREFLDNFQVERSRDREQSRMRRELDSARQIQLSMLPRRDPRFPGLDISAASLPAAEVGGDYYEYFPLDDHRLVVVLADVAGHGVASGLMLSGVRSCLHLMKGTDQPAAVILSRLDEMVRATTQRRMFITLLYALIDLRKAELTVASAGHPPPILVRQGQAHIPDLQSPPLGTQLRHQYSEVVMPLLTGDRIVLYTDGLTEMMNDSEDLYGDTRLAARVCRVDPAHDARAVREAVLTDVWNFKGNDDQEDDVTLISIRVGDLSRFAPEAKPA